MDKIATTGKRHLKGDLWYDDNGPITGSPADWVPPMTDDEIEIAARADPSAQPMTDAQLAAMRADFVRIVFNIKGNSYRLVVAVDFEKAIVFIKWIGTHADYDRIDVRRVQRGD